MVTDEEVERAFRAYNRVIMEWKACEGPHRQKGLVDVMRAAIAAALEAAREPVE